MMLGLAVFGTAYAHNHRAAEQLASPVGDTSQCPWLDSHLPIARRVAMIMQKMTLADKIRVVEGQGSNNPYVFYVAGNKKLCMPPLGLEDGPEGVADGLTGVTKLPSGASLAATFSRPLAYRYGTVIGAEQSAKGSSVDLGPTVNIDRDPRWGREFESLSEDPLLSADLGAAEIRGIQSRRVMAQVKHFAAYNQEINRNTAQDDVLVSQRALHEIYEPAFRKAIRHAKAASVMCAYSVVNGDFSCQSKPLLTGVLRDEWNFPGFVTSDYAAIHDLSAAAAGTDQEQPFANYFGTALQSAVQNGSEPLAVLNTMVERTLREMFRFHFFAHPPSGSTSATATTPAHRALSTRVAEAGTVLLKNRSSLLPLGSGDNIAVIGPAASAQVTYGGGGSAHVRPSSTVTPLAGIQAAADSSVRYAQGLPTDSELTPIPSADLSVSYDGTGFGESYSATLTAPETGTYVIGFTNACGCYNATNLKIDGKTLISNPGTPPSNQYSAAIRLQKGQHYTLSLKGVSSTLSWATPSDLKPYLDKAVKAAESARVAVVVVADNTESEAADRPSLALPSAQNALISAVAKANPRTVVVVQAGAPIAMPWLARVPSLLDTWYSGQTNGTALADVLFGKTDPGGHLPVTFPARLADVPAASRNRFPGVDGKVHYDEGLLVGYRWYDAKHIKPMFPFGFGLSYTTFRYSDLHLSRHAVNGVTPVHVSARVTNVGQATGTDVAQLYLSFPAASGEPPRRLVDFKRVKLAPGQSRTVHFTITPRDEWWWQHGGWNETPGQYRVQVGDSSAESDLPLAARYLMNQAIGNRHVAVHAPASFKPGVTRKVSLSLSAGGREVLHDTRLKLDAPGNWRVVPLGSTAANELRPEQSMRATFAVTPPSGAVTQDVTLYGTADLSARRCASGPHGWHGGHQHRFGHEHSRAGHDAGERNGRDMDRHVHFAMKYEAHRFDAADSDRGKASEHCHSVARHAGKTVRLLPATTSS